jgi:hypothetical protein
MDAPSAKTKRHSTSTLKEEINSTVMTQSFNPPTIPDNYTGLTEMERTRIYAPTAQQNEKIELPPTEAWARALACLDSDNYSGAYKCLLDAGDDLYLIRLMYKTGPDCYRLLDEQTSLRLFSRVIAIAKSQFMNDLVVDFFFEACDSGLASQIDSETIEAMLMVLECIESSSKHGPLLKIVMDYLKTLRTHN